jgi:hypothetical protein
MIQLLGAEKQSAVSLALAYPDRQFQFVSDHRVMDGGDLPNTSLRFAQVDSFRAEPGAIALCPRWVRTMHGEVRNRLGTWDLPPVLDAVGARFGGTLPVAGRPDGEQEWIVKGASWHRPDFTVVGRAAEVVDTADPYGCGVVFQPVRRADATLLAVGRRFASGRMGFGVFRVYGEAQCRESLLLAAETAEEPGIASRTTEILRFLDHRGCFSMNWIIADGQSWVTSIRPVPRAVAQALRRGGVDLLVDGAPDVVVAPAGVKTVASQHYAEYEPLGP